MICGGNTDRGTKTLQKYYSLLVVQMLMFFTSSLLVCRAAETQYKVVDLGVSELSVKPNAWTLNSYEGNLIVNKSVSGKLGPHHAFLVHKGQMVDIGSLGGPNVVAFGINASVQIVGAADVADNTEINGPHPIVVTAQKHHAFLNNFRTMNDLGTLPGGANSQANAINNFGDIVGCSDVSPRGQHGFICFERSSKMLDLNALLLPQSPWEIETAVAISDDDKIVAYGVLKNVAHLLLLIPTSPLDRR